MYTESRNNFSLRNVILQFLFLALLVFILIWLFPTKKDVKKANNNSSNEKITINNTTKKVNIANKTSFSYPLNLKELKVIILLKDYHK